MKAVETCGKCGSRSKKCSVDISVKDRDKFLAFTQNLQKSFATRGDSRGGLLFIPPSKYPRHPLVIPSIGENPCTHCKIGEDTVGPSGCGRGSTCMAFLYFSMNILKQKTEPPLSAVVDKMSS